MFHAVSDNNNVRGEVFDLLKTFKFDVHCTLLDKPKAYPRTRTDEATFYKFAWYYHGKYLAQNVFQCFDAGCGKKGDVIDLWARVNGVSLRQAAIELVGTFHLEPAPE